MSTQQKQYDGPPSTFVNLKRVKLGEKDSKGKDKYAFTFGTTTDRDGNTINTADQLIAALIPYQGKQVNLCFHVGEVESAQGRTFPSGYVRVTEMIPKDVAAGGKTAFVPKQSRADALKEKADGLSKQFSK